MNLLPLFQSLPKFFERRPASVRYGVSNEEYYAIPALNASVLKKRTALDMLHLMAGEREEKDCFDLGGNLHCAVLEPERWEKSLVILPEDAPARPTARKINAKKPSKDTVAAIEWWKEFDAQNAGKTVLTEEEHDQVVQMHDALLRHHRIRELLEAPGNNEVVVEAWDEEFGVMLKARFDRLPGGCFDGRGEAVPSFVIDIKTTSGNIDSDASMRGEILKWGYHIQARFYMRLLSLVLDEPARDVFYFPFVTTKAPYKSRLYKLDIYQSPDNLLTDADEILFQRGEHTVGRVPMFVHAAHEFIQRIQEKHADPMGAWTAYEDEDARPVEGKR